MLVKLQVVPTANIAPGQSLYGEVNGSHKQRLIVPSPETTPILNTYSWLGVRPGHVSVKVAPFAEQARELPPHVSNNSIFKDEKAVPSRVATVVVGVNLYQVSSYKKLMHAFERLFVAPTVE